MDETIWGHLAEAQVLEVDPMPEKNGPAKIYPFQNKSLGIDLYDGYLLELQDLDNRWTQMEDEVALAFLVAPNENLLKHPSTSYGYLKAVEEEEAGQQAVGFTDVSFKNAISTS